MKFLQISLLVAASTLINTVFAQETVNVLLQEWRIIADTKTVKSGEIVFSVENRGREPHEFVILKTDLPHDQLPMMSSGGLDEAKAGAVIDEIEDITTFAKRSLTTYLKPGNYVLLCNMVEMEEGQLEQHYVMGMRIPLRVVP